MAKQASVDKEENEFALIDPFALEQIFPSIEQLFESHGSISAAGPNVLVAIDTNALLLPYSFKAGNLNALKDVYKKLAEQERLFLPDRVVREFARLRDYKLSEIIQALQDRKSAGFSGEMPPLLDSTNSFPLIAASRAELDKAKDAYSSAIGGLVDEIKEWRGDDPIVKIYSEVFRTTNIEALSYDKEFREKYLADWRWRSSNKIPPGYKDQSKDDNGIGDYLIWMALLNLGEKHKKDLAFVTGEQKADWFVRSGKSGVFPRPELVAEYRNRSSGRSLRLLTLNELLLEMNAPATVVADVKEAEESANTAISAGTSIGNFTLSAHVQTRFIGKKIFDYSTNDGKIEIVGGGTLFILRFSKAGDQSIYLYKDGTNLTDIGRLKTAAVGQRIVMENYDTSSRAYAIRTGEHFIARNDQGRLLIGKILKISDDTRGAAQDEVAFIYTINRDPDDAAIAP